MYTSKERRVKVLTYPSLGVDFAEVPYGEAAASYGLAADTLSKPRGTTYTPAECDPTNSVF